MIRNIFGLGLLAGASQANSPISVVCNKDNTIDVNLAYDQAAEVLEFKYGDCDLSSTRANLTQHSDFGFAFQLDVNACNMNDNLRTLQYNQTVSMRIGRKSAGSEITLATFSIDSYCIYTSSYKVKFDYGQIATETAAYSSDAGLVNLTFALKSYNADFSSEEAHPTKAGKMINLGLSIENANFDHADDIATSQSGKVFAPRSCKVVNSDRDEYTLFDYSSKSCANSDIEFSIKYDQADNMWQFSHILFLLNDNRVSQLNLECDVIVCDRQKSDDCDAVVRACTKPVDGEITWGNFSDCSKTCYNDDNDRMGTKSKVGVCKPPKFFGSPCGALSETANCTSPRCPIDGNWAPYGNWTECSKECGSGNQTRTRTCSDPPKQFGGNDCNGTSFEVRICNESPCLEDCDDSQHIIEAVDDVPRKPMTCQQWFDSGYEPPKNIEYMCKGLVTTDDVTDMYEFKVGADAAPSQKLGEFCAGACAKYAINNNKGWEPKCKLV